MGISCRLYLTKSSLIQDMKVIFALCFFCSSLAFAQFSTDVVVKQSGIVSYTDPDAACASNGNLLVAYLVDSAGVKGCQVSMSTNYGISWFTTYSFMDPYQQVNDVAIATSGVGADERVFVLIAFHNLLSNLSTLNLIELGASTGGYINTLAVETGMASRHYAIDMDSDANYPSTGQINVGMITAYSGVVTDSLKYFYWNGISLTSKLVKGTVDEFVGHAHINYANNTNFSGLFFMAWDELKFQPIPLPGFYYEKVFYASTGSNVFAPGVIPYTQVDNLMAANTDRSYKPYVVSQNNAGSPPTGTGSYGLLHGLVFLRDSIDIYSSNILGYVNNSYSSFVPPATAYNPEATFIQVLDYAAFNWANEHHIIYQEKTTGDLRWLLQPDFINNPGTNFTDEFIPGGHINDNPALTENPDPAITVNRLNNSPAFFWIDQVAGKGALKYDAPYMSAFAAIPTLENNQEALIFPNPLGKQMLSLTMHLENPTQLMVSVLNGQGQMLDTFTLMHIGGGTQQMTLKNLNHLPAGTYYLHIKTNDNLVVRKLVRVD